MKVFLTGATGFVGKGVLSSLIRDGHEVVCLVRPGSRQKINMPENGQQQLQLHEGDLFHPASLQEAMRDCDAVIHLVGIIREFPRKEITFARLHVEGTRNVLQAAKRAGIRRFVHMSALGSRANAASAYHRTKYEAEQLVQVSGIPYTIFRPSVIFGPGDGFVNMLADLVRLPLTPVIGDGSYPLQPISRHTVADAFSQALTKPEAENRVFEMGGPQQLRYDEILDLIGEAMGKRVRKVHIPLFLMKPTVRLLEGFSFFPLTGTQLTMLLEGNVCQEPDSLYHTFSLTPIPFKKGIREYIR